MGETATANGPRIICSLSERSRWVWTSMGTPRPTWTRRGSTISGTQAAGVREPSSSRSSQAFARAFCLSQTARWSNGCRLNEVVALPRLFNLGVPSVINSPGITSVNGIAVPAPYFDENLPLRNGTPFTVRLDGTSRVIQSPVINTVAGATKIQQVLDYIGWASQSASSVAYAPHLRRDPLNGVPAKSVIVQFAFGDRLVPNPSTTAILRAGDLTDRATFFRTDLRFPVNPVPGSNLYPHVFMDFAITSTNYGRQGDCGRSAAADRLVLRPRRGRSRP